MIELFSLRSIFIHFDRSVFQRDSIFDTNSILFGLQKESGRLRSFPYDYISCFRSARDSVSHSANIVRRPEHKRFSIIERSL